MKHWQKGLCIGSFLVVLSGLTACTATTPSQQAEANSNLSEEASPADAQDLGNHQTTKISLQEALAIAEAAVEGKAHAMEREVEDNIPIVEIELGDEEVLVDAESGEIILVDNLREKGDPEDLEEIAEALELQPLATITMQDALEAAERFAGGQAHTAELENEEGNLVYEVVIGLEEIYVDAGTGQVLFTETIGQDNNSDDSQPQSSIQVPFDEDENEEDDD